MPGSQRSRRSRRPGSTSRHPRVAVEAAARERGLRFRVHHEDTSGWLSSRRVGATTAGSKVLVEEDSGRILGAHLLGPHADEVINVFAVAVRFGIRADDLRQVLFAYPTNGADIPSTV